MTTLKPKTLKPQEAFYQLGISRNIGYKLIHSGGLHHIKVGRIILIPVWAVDELLEEGTEKTSTDLED